MARYEIRFSHDKDYNTELQIWVDNKLVDSFWDGGEPEDNSFGRDWYWGGDYESINNRFT